ncbi:unnamed protein product [Paramecium octaurelia]|uniref:Uncharacterized protein n=1 Tax=Paramecium octaurelia TaxID=43137 RepID=A0A8S1V0Y7_PAROT|nr:unnamed protein product [Paramecium octaurelia]
MLIGKQHLLFSDLCQLIYLVYINQASSIILLSLITVLYASSLIFEILSVILKNERRNQIIHQIGYSIKMISFWFAYQAKQEYILCSLLQTQILFNNTDLKSKPQYPILILGQMSLFIFNLKQIVLDYEQIIIIIVQLAIFSLWLYRDRCIKQRGNIEVREQQNQQQCTIDIQVDTIKQQQNLIQTNSTKRINSPQNSLLFNDQFELLETQINFAELLTHQNQYNQAFEILLNLNFNYIQETALKQCELRIIVFEMQIDEQLLLTIDKNEYFKYENHAMLINCIVINGIKCFQIQFFPLPLQINNNKETDESMEIDMCRSLSHELGTNLNSIVTFTKMALKDDIVDSHLKSKYLEPIRINSEQLNLIVGTIRDYNLINLKQFSLKLEELDLEAEIRFIVSLLNESFENKNIKIDYHFDLQSNVLVNDKIRFRQVLFQLMQNAVKYTFESSITITILNDILECFISIADNGIGMTEQEAENMNSLLQSNKFVKVSEQSVGVGLGLGISNQLVKQMSGKNNSIQLSRNNERGCQFSFFIKNHQLEMSKEFMRKQSSGFIKKSSQTIRFISANTYIEDQVKGQSKQKIQIQKSQIQTNTNSQQQFKLPSTNRINFYQESKNQSEEDSLSSIHPPILSPKFQQSIVQCSLNSDCCSRVLIVDDEYFNIQCLKLLMTKYQSKCDSAYNGKEAIQLVNHKKHNPCKKCGNRYYSLIFLDINMPILDGYKTVKELKHLMKQQIINKTWCIANTGFCDLDTKLKSYEAGMDYYLTKPLDQNELRTILNVLFPINDY